MRLAQDSFILSRAWSRSFSLILFQRSLNEEEELFPWEEPPGRASGLPCLSGGGPFRSSATAEVAKKVTMLAARHAPPSRLNGLAIFMWFLDYGS
jgi:hypothetical protein